MAAVLLQARDGVRRAAHAAGGAITAHAVTRLETQVEVGAADVPAARNERERVDALPVRRGDHQPERRLVVELAPDAAGRIAGERLDRLALPDAAVEDARRLLLRDGLHGADRVLADAARQLRGAQNRRLCGDGGVDVVARRKRIEALWRSPNASGIE